MFALLLKVIHKKMGEFSLPLRKAVRVNKRMRFQETGFLFVRRKVTAPQRGGVVKLITKKDALRTGFF